MIHVQKFSRVFTNLLSTQSAMLKDATVYKYMYDSNTGYWSRGQRYVTFAPHMVMFPRYCVQVYVHISTLIAMDTGYWSIGQRYVTFALHMVMYRSRSDGYSTLIENVWAEIYRSTVHEIWSRYEEFGWLRSVDRLNKCGQARITRI